MAGDAENGGGDLLEVLLGGRNERVEVTAGGTLGGGEDVLCKLNQNPGLSDKLRVGCTQVGDHGLHIRHQRRDSALSKVQLALVLDRGSEGRQWQSRKEEEAELHFEWELNERVTWVR